MYDCVSLQDGEGALLPSATAVWPVGAVLCNLVSIVKGEGSASIDRRLGSIGGALKTNAENTLLERLSELEGNTSPVSISVQSPLYVL